MEEILRSDKQSCVDKAFKSGSVWTDADENLQEYLQTLSTGYVSNDNVRHREIIRGTTINNIQMGRFIARLNKSNRRLSYLVVILTITAVMSGVAQILLALC